MIEAARFFGAMRERRLGPQAMMKFALSIGDFCTRTRSDLESVAVALERRGHSTYGARLREIGISEQKHACSFAAIALELLRQTNHNLVSRLAADPTACETLFQGARSIDDPEVSRAMDWAQALAAETYADVFAARRDPGRPFFAFGGIRAVEKIAEEDIIPGEIRAFGPGSVYALDVTTHPELGYLREHVEAEEWHHEFMEEMYAALPLHERAEADRGYAAAMHAFAQWFTRLHKELFLQDQ